jgi:hypothetical protein
LRFNLEAVEAALSERAAGREGAHA